MADFYCHLNQANDSFKCWYYRILKPNPNDGWCDLNIVLRYIFLMLDDKNQDVAA